MPRLLGPILATYAIERLAYGLIDQHIGLYLDEVTRQQALLARARAIDRVERPRSVTIREGAGRLPEEQLPAIVLVCPGTVGEPRRSGDGTYRATWALRVLAAQQSSDAALGRELAGIMAAAASALLVQTLPLADERIVGIRWTGESTRDLTVGERTIGDLTVAGVTLDDDRSRQYCARALELTVDGVMSDLGGPPPTLEDPPIGEPPADAGDLADVETVGLTTTPVQEIA